MEIHDAQNRAVGKEGECKLSPDRPSLGASSRKREDVLLINDHRLLHRLPHLPLGPDDN